LVVGNFSPLLGGETPPLHPDCRLPQKPPLPTAKLPTAQKLPPPPTIGRGNPTPTRRLPIAKQRPLNKIRENTQDKSHRIW